jgi:hypothetical protein
MEETTNNSTQGLFLLISFLVLFIGLVVMWFNLRAENRRRRQRNEQTPDPDPGPGV